MNAETKIKSQPKSFESLTPELAQWILDFTKHSGYTRCTPVQAMVIPIFLQNKDVVVEAVTGSGKTLSFLIPLVERLLKSDEPNKKGHVRSIVIAPTKELASQIYTVLRGMLAFHEPSIAYLQSKAVLHSDLIDDDDDTMEKAEVPPGPYVVPQLLTGGRTKLHEDIVTFNGLNPNVLIGTPKRMIEVLQSSKVVLKRHWFDMLVLDEADRLLDHNFHADISKILDVLPKERRTGLFSASVSEALNELVRVGLRYPFKISARVRSKTGSLDKKTPESLKLFHIVTKPTLKLPILRQIIKESEASRCICYVSTRAGVDYWNHILPALLGISVFPLHGDHKAEIRARNLRKFRECQTAAMLLTTDVLARGIDISDVDLVVQLDPPTQPKDFIHRCGRSGRAGKRGMAITFLHEGNEENYIEFHNLQGIKLEPYPDVPLISESDITETIATIRTVLTRKREIHDRSQKAYVSWVQAYNKTLPADIFAVKSLDWSQTARAWGLLRWPKMPELKRYFPKAVEDRKFELELPEGFDLTALQYTDPVREEQRQEIVSAMARGERPKLPGKSGGALADLRRRKENAWSAQKDAKAVREARRERKEVRRKAEGQAKMTDAEKLKAVELADLVAKVRAQNAAANDDTFEGFDD